MKKIDHMVLAMMLGEEKQEAEEAEAKQRVVNAWIAKPEELKEAILKYGPNHPDHPEHQHEDCCK